MKFGKKGSQFWPADTFPFTIFFIFVSTISALFLVILFSNDASSQSIVNGNLESFNLAARFLSSQKCFSYEHNGIQSGYVIDSSKFAIDRFNDCYKVPEGKFPAFRIRLVSATGGIDSTIKTINWNDNRGHEQKNLPLDVIIYSNNMLHNGEMSIEIQNLQ